MPAAQVAMAAEAMRISAASVGPLAAAAKTHAATAALVTLIFALLGFRVRGVDVSGAVAGAVLAFVLYVSAGPGAFVLVAVVFVLAAGTTSMGYTRKRELGLAERKAGRNAAQVAANLGVAALCALLSLYYTREALLLCTTAALGEAAADTVSSECGQAFGRRAYLITGFKRVRVGTDGAISAVGTLAGIAAAFLLAVVGVWARLLPHRWMAAAAGAAFIGMIIDSVLGASLQRRGWLTNNLVNLLSTAAAAGMALVFLL